MDWEAVEERWDLHQYRAMQDHWLRVAPPAYVSLAVANGYEGRDESGGGDFIQDPAELEAALSQMPGGRIRRIES